MSVLWDQGSRPDVEITAAATAGCSRLRSAVHGRIETHAAGDGGLLCEDRSVPSRPRLWRISPDGIVVPDTPYNYRVRAFIPAVLPHGLTAT